MASHLEPRCDVIEESVEIRKASMSLFFSETEEHGYPAAQQIGKRLEAFFDREPEHLRALLASAPGLIEGHLCGGAPLAVRVSEARFGVVGESSANRRTRCGSRKADACHETGVRDDHRLPRHRHSVPGGSEPLDSVETGTCVSRIGNSIFSRSTHHVPG